MKRFLHVLILLLLMSASLFAQTTLFSDNFDSYSTSQKLAEQAAGTEWTTWSGTPGSGEDAAISTEQAFSGANSAKVVSGNDLVLNLGGKTTGRYQVKFLLNVSTGKSCFVGFMPDFTGNDTKFGLTLYFKGDGGELNVGGKTYEFAFNYNQWVLINTIIDLDDDFATMYIEGNEIASWIWSKGSDGGSNINKLDVIDFWGYNADGTTCQYYIDDVEYNQLTTLDTPTNLISSLTNKDVSLSWDAPASGSPTEYAITRNSAVIGKTANLTYDDINVYPGVYNYTVRAKYGENGFSAASNEEQQTISGGVAREMVLYEIVTGTWCYYCPGAAMAVHDMIEENLDVAVVRYHTGDNYEFAEGINRQTYYDFGGGVPSAKIDGVYSYVGGSANESIYPVYKPFYDQRKQVLSTHNLDLEITKIDDTNFKASITVTQESAYFASDLVLITALTESNIADNWQNQTEVNFACRDLYPNANGTVLDFSSSATQIVTIDFSVDASWVAGNCEFVAFVQYNQTKEIIQAIKSEITAPSVTISVPDASTGVALDEDIIFAFSDPIRHINNDTIVALDTMIVFKQGSASGSDITFIASINEALNQITIKHDSLDGNTTYYLELSSYIENFYDMQVEDELSITFTTVVATGIIEQEIIRDLSIYPNPFRDKLNISYFSENDGKSVIEIYNQSGMLIKSKTQDRSGGNQLIEINTEELSNGIYFINLRIGNDRVSKKIVLLR